MNAIVFFVSIYTGLYSLAFIGGGSISSRFILYRGSIFSATVFRTSRYSLLVLFAIVLVY